MARGTRSRSRKDTPDTATTQVDDRTTAVDQAATAAAAADAPEAVSSATDAVSDATATEIGAAREVDAELAGQDLELSEEQLAETIPTPDDDADGLAGVPSVEDLKNRKPGDDLAGVDGDPDAPSDDPRERAEASKEFNPFGTVEAGGFGETSGQANAAAEFTGTGAAAQAIKDAGIFDLIDQPGETDGDPLSSFLGAAEAKLGHGTGLTTPSDQPNASPAHGLISAAAPSGSTYYVNEHGAKVTTYDDGTRSVDNYGNGTFVTTWPDGERQLVKADGTETWIHADGSTETKDKDGKVIDSTPPLTQPDPEHEGAPLPESIQKQLDADVARLRATRPQTDDGTTDPSEIEGEAVGPAGALPDHAELGQSLFGQPDTEAPSGSDSNFNPGADSSGAGVITPGEDQSVSIGRTRNDDPFADAGPAPEPVTSSNDATADSESFLPSETTGAAIDDRPDIPDPVNDPA